MSYAPGETWELQSVFAGGPGGAAFAAALAGCARRVEALVARADALPARPDASVLAALLVDLEAVAPEVQQVVAFAGCHAATDASGREAVRGEAMARELGNRLDRAWVHPRARVATADEADFAALVDRPELASMRGLLRDRRRLARFQLPEAEAALATELGRDGIFAWGEQYKVDAAGLRVPFDRGQGEDHVSPGQLAALLSHPDKALRDRAHATSVAGWRTIASRCAKSLGHITGTRRVLNARLGVDAIDAGLAGANIERRTLDAMFEAVRSVRPMMHDYLARKARLLGQDQLSWADTVAPVGDAGGTVSYADAQDQIVGPFEAFSPALATFARRALRGGWVEVEDRPGKRGGGFCTRLPATAESRIFMTWGGTVRSVSTLAHELGHAYHNDVLYGVPVSQRRVPATLAETASTFAEALVREATLAAVDAPARRLRLVDSALVDAVSFLCKIPARYELELALYRMRARGPLEVDALDAEAAALLGTWLGPSAAVDATIWASTMHYYIAGMSFYNFPYVFGYLFSSLVYTHFRPLGAAGAPAYERLLRRTGDEWAEPIARDELGVDLGDPETWLRALAPVRRDHEAFVALTGGR